jgi:homoserine O-acetyltransferase
MMAEPTIEADFVSSEPFALVSGEVLPELKQRYAIYGEMNPDRSNVVLVCHALTGSARIYEWWGDLIGEGKALDTSRNAFLLLNYIGSC